MATASSWPAAGGVTFSSLVMVVGEANAEGEVVVGDAVACEAHHEQARSLQPARHLQATGIQWAQPKAFDERCSPVRMPANHTDIAVTKGALRSQAALSTSTGGPTVACERLAAGRSALRRSAQKAATERRRFD